MIFILGLIVSVTLIIIGIIKFKIHPFLVLIGSAICYALIAGMSTGSIIQAINEGFGGVLGNIGLIIIFGVIIGTFLEKSGGAHVIAEKVLKIVGERSIYLAMMLVGYVVSIPVFCDSGFIMLNSLNKVLTKKSGASFAASSGALALGLLATHVMVPPTPGPIAAAGILGADLGLVILWGVIVSFLGLIPCLFFFKIFSSKIVLEIEIEETTSNLRRRPPLTKAIMPILVPIVLILLKSIADYPGNILGNGQAVEVIRFVGTPVIALVLGLFLSFSLPARLEKRMFAADGWVGQSLKTVTPILLITGAGGIFGKMIQLSGMVDFIKDEFVFSGVGLLFPFLMAALLKTAQGSSTVALITTAAILAPLMGVLGLDTEILMVLTVLAIGAGSACVSHANDSFFWVVTQMTGMNVKQGNQILTLGTAIFGLSAIVMIYLLSLIL